MTKTTNMLPAEVFQGTRVIKAQHLAIKNGGDVMIDWYKEPIYTGGLDLPRPIGVY